MPSSVKTKAISELALLLAVAVVLRLAENFLPQPFPGARLGLANFITIFVLYRYKIGEALLFLAARIILVGILGTGLASSGFFIGLAGALVSFAVMAAAVRSGLFSTLGVGLAGAASHSTAQLAAASCFISSRALLAYLPILLLLAIPTGLLTGFVAGKLLKIRAKR